jgi:sulfur carrier protein ThiS
MINLTIGTNTERKSVIVEPEQTLSDVLAENSVNVNGCALHLNGSLIAGVDTDSTFEELGVADGTKATLIAVIKADSAK